MTLEHTKTIDRPNIKVEIKVFLQVNISLLCFFFFSPLYTTLSGLMTEINEFAVAGAVESIFP